MSTNATLSNLLLPNGLTVANLLSTNATLSNLLLPNGLTIGSIKASNILSGFISTGSLSSLYGTISNLLASSISTSTFTSDSVLSGNGMYTNLTSTNINGDNLTLTTSLISNNGSVTNFSSSSLNTTNINSINGTIGSLITNGINIGIGTTNANQRLYVNGNTYSDNLLLPVSGRITNNLTDNFTFQGVNIPYNGILWRPDTDVTSGNVLYNSGFGGIRMLSQGQTRLFVKDTGNIGINTTSPGYTLDVNGDFRSNNLTSGNIKVNNINTSSITYGNALGTNMILTNSSITNLNTNNLSSININGTNITSGTIINTNLSSLNNTLSNLIVTNNVTCGNILISNSTQNSITIDCKNSITNPGRIIFKGSNGTGDFNVSGDGGDTQWLGGGNRSLQMGSFHELYLRGGRASTSNITQITGNGSTRNTVIVNENNSIGLTVQSATGQTSDLQQWTGSTGGVLLSVNSLGDIYSRGYLVSNYSQYVKDLTQTSTSGTVPIRKLLLTTANVPSGDYSIDVYTTISSTGSNKLFNIEIRLDTVTLEKFTNSMTNSVLNMGLSYQDIVTLTSGVHTIELYYYVNQGQTITLQNSKIILKRFS